MVMTLFEDWDGHDDDNEGVIGEDGDHDDHDKCKIVCQIAILPRRGQRN